MPPIRSTNLLLTFDAFGTLFTPKISIAAQYVLVAQGHGLVGVKEGDVRVAFKKAFKEESKRNPNYGKSNGLKPEEWWTSVVTNTFTSITSSPLPPSLAPTLIRRFASNIGYRLYPESIPLLRAIRLPPPNWPYNLTTIGVITNSDPRVTPVLNSLGVGVRLYSSTTPDQYENKGGKALLDFVTLSYDVGCEKPDVGIFNAARTTGQSVSGSGAGVWRYVHVGDDPVRDYQGAESAGWNAILVDRMAREKRSTCKVVVRELDEVLGVLIDLEKSHGSV